MQCLDDSHPLVIEAPCRCRLTFQSLTLVRIQRVWYVKKAPSESPCSFAEASLQPERPDFKLVLIRELSVVVV